MEFMWKLAASRRKTIGAVADFGAGDARFAAHSKYASYKGFEIDRKRMPTSRLPPNATVVNTDAFNVLNPEFDICIGNPPYVKGSELNNDWREGVCQRIERRTSLAILRNSNLFVYFLFLALLRTRNDVLVVQLVPYEWVTRPSAKSLREFIRENNWSVDVYRFTSEIFDRVLTTACVTVIDKSVRRKEWKYYEISKDFEISAKLRPSGSRNNVLQYSARNGDSWCLRGLSPGAQSLFVLTEHERAFFRLRVDSDVYPAVTTLRGVPDEIRRLDRAAFHKFFVDRDAKCWLIKSDSESPSTRVMDYLTSIKKKEWIKYSTCSTRSNWWQFKNHPAAPIILASGFRGTGPKTMVNEVGAIACGSVYAVFAKTKKAAPDLVDKLREFDFSSRIVGHSNGLKKLEVNQVNSVLQTLGAV
jgi:hypothetical protein